MLPLWHLPRHTYAARPRHRPHGPTGAAHLLVRSCCCSRVAHAHVRAARGMAHTARARPRSSHTPCKVLVWIQRAAHGFAHPRQTESRPIATPHAGGILIPIESCCRTVTATSFTRSIVARSTLLPHACKFEIHRPRQNKGELRRQHAPRTSTIESHRNHVPEV